MPAPRCPKCNGRIYCKEATEMPTMATQGGEVRQTYDVFYCENYHVQTYKARAERVAENAPIRNQTLAE